MPATNSLGNLYGTIPDEGAPYVWVYSPQRNQRLDYVSRFVFNRVLKCNYDITTSEEEYKRASGTRINYSLAQLPGLQIKPEGLLNETNVRSNKPTALQANGQLYFFSIIRDNSGFHFDVLSAVFYFISRYEEWQDYKPDNHGRFEAQASLLFQHGAHLKPLVDQWIWELAGELKKQNPEIRFSTPSFEFLSTIDVDNLYAYKAKGFWRICGASVRDLLKLNLKHFTERFAVLLGSKKDPFDVYDDIPAFAKEQGYDLVFFFLYRTGTRFDRTVKPGTQAFVDVFNRLQSRGVQMGLHPSYDSAFEENLLKNEYDLICTNVNQKIRFTRNHFLRYNIRNTPHELLKLGVKADFTMGFASQPGFRAGTAHPFYYFNLNTNQAAELLFVPFCAMDGAFLIYNKVEPEGAMKIMMQMAQEVKKTGGYYVTVFHESTISNHLYNGFGTLYKNLHQYLKQLRSAEI